MGLRVHYRHLGRYREVANAMARHGFGFVLAHLGLDHLLGLPKRLLHRSASPNAVPRGARLRLFLAELGPTFIKLGQILSTRPDLLPPDVISELARLQDRVDPVPFAAVEERVKEEMGRPIDEVFAAFDPSPLASASIGQVHQATLPNGDAVVVKVQRPGIVGKIEEDLEILGEMATLARRRSTWAEMYDFEAIAAEFARTIRNELDYRTEAENAELFRRNLAAEADKVYIPRVYRRYSSEHILSMELVVGQRLYHLLEKGETSGAERRRLAETIARSLLRQILIDGFFHADPHPANILILEDGRVALLDFGMVGHLGEGVKDRLVELLIGLVERDADAIVEAVMRLGDTPVGIDRAALRRDVERLRARYYELPLNRLRIGEVIQEMFSLAFQYRIRIPTDSTLVAKALVTLEGVIGQLDPEVRLIELAEPFGHQLVKERLVARYLGRDAWRRLAVLGQDLLALPGSLREAVRLLAGGRLSLTLEAREFEPLLTRLDRIANRLSLGLVLLAASILMAGVLIAASLEGQRTVLWNLPLIGFGFLFSSLLFIWMVWSILRSGRP